MSNDKDINSKLIQWSNKYLSNHLIYPSINDIKKYSLKLGYNLNKEEILKFRNSLEAITKYNKLNRSSQRKYGYIPNNISSLGWIQADLGFIEWKRKKYGKFILAVDELSQMVHVESISNKKYETLKKFFVNLKKQPGFQYMRRVFTDQEAALLSRKNRNDLEINLPDVKFFVSKRKANQAERYIRSFKLYISKILLAKQLSYTKWRDFINIVLNKMNTKMITKIGMRPIDINKKTLDILLNKLLLLKPYTRVNFYGVPLPSETIILKKLFKYNIGDKVYFSKSNNPDLKIKNLTKFETISLAGHFDKTLPVYTVNKRSLITTKKLYIIPLYNLINDITGKEL